MEPGIEQTRPAANGHTTQQRQVPDLFEIVVDQQSQPRAQRRDTEVQQRPQLSVERHRFLPFGCGNNRLLLRRENALPTQFTHNAVWGHIQRF